MELQSGIYGTTGDGTTTTFSFPHGCTTGTPNAVVSDNTLHFNKTGGPVALRNYCDATNINVEFLSAPASGVTMNWNWIAIVN